VKYGLFGRVITCHNRSAPIFTICARNVHRIHGHKCLDDDASLRFLLPWESDSVVFWMRRGAVLLKHKQLIMGQPALVASDQEGCRDSMPFNLTPNLTSLTVINPVLLLAKYLEHPHLTR